MTPAVTAGQPMTPAGEAGRLPCDSRIDHPAGSWLESGAGRTPLIMLTRGGAAVPLFMTHGLGGEVGELGDIARALGTRRPMYGVQWQGLDGDAPPHATIDDMARYFADAIAAAEPDGPYLLAGLSVGGIAMLEVARILSERNKEVALVALIDTYPHARYWPLWSWAAVLAPRVSHHVRAMAHMSWRQAIADFRKRSRSLWDKIAARRGAALGWQYADAQASPALRLLRDTAYRAFAQFPPRGYAGKVAFLKAGVTTVFPANPRPIWRGLIPHMEIHTIPCVHEELNTVFAQQLADRLARCIDEATAEVSEK